MAKEVTGLKELSMKALEKDARLDFCLAIDDKHLDSLWYRGIIASILYCGYNFEIVASGSVDLVLLDENEEVIFEYNSETENGDGHTPFYDKAKEHIADDKQLEDLLSNGRLSYSLNNWFELFVSKADSTDSCIERTVDACIRSRLDEIIGCTLFNMDSIINDIEKSKEVTKSVTLKDSGARRQFDSGAVRDIAEGKGRCDLLPLALIGDIINDNLILDRIEEYIRTGNRDSLTTVIEVFSKEHFGNIHTALLEVAKHYEAGAKKYDERNWEKGIPLHCYIDSAVRHYLKHLRGDVDEPHDRAFLWNLLGALWTEENHPELNDLPFANDKENHND